MPSRADAGGGEIHRDGRSEPARADAQHLRRLQLALTVDADLRHDQVPRVALDLVVGQWRQITSCGELRTTSLEPLSAPPATDGMMLIVSLACTGVCSFCRYRMSSSFT